jgi:ATP-dependent Clp protease ATP-binding subunit ClpC
MRDLFIEGLSIRQQLEFAPSGEAQFESEWLFFPELKSFGADDGKLVKEQEKILQEFVYYSSCHELSQRVIPDVDMVAGVIAITLDFPRDVPLWGSPLELNFPYLTWEQNKTWIAYVPALGIEVAILTSPGKEQIKILEEQIHFAIERRRISYNLFELSLLQRCQEISIERFEWAPRYLSPKDRSIRDEGHADETNLLKEIGTRIDHGSPEPIYEREPELQQIAAALKSRRGGTSLLLVGENGVGKTALIHNLAVQQRALGLEAREIYYIPGSRIVAGMGGYGEWQDRCRRLVAEASEKKAKILYLGNLMELMEVGPSAGSIESVGSFFRPWLVRGQLLAIAECTPSQLSMIEQKHPRILEAFRQVKLEPPNYKQAITILKQVVEKNKREVLVNTAVVNRIFALHRRYAGYSAMPGKMLHFTKRLLSQDSPKNNMPIDRISTGMVNRLFALETGLPSFLLDDLIRFSIADSRDWFLKRIKGQDAAIDDIINTIAVLKARLTRPHRPLGSFLFVGPTGVGKTELAKTVAEFFYGSPDRLLRIDMSEYSIPGSSARLVSGGPGEAEGILTSKMRDQPFSVVLLDEIEKAEDGVFDLFLQVLGEARLTDGAGRLADFSNAIIILTSNLGAAEFSAVAPGFGNPHIKIGLQAVDHFVAAARKKFRPEFFNRIGRIVPFLPLDHETVQKVLVREVSKLDERDGFKNRDLTLVVSDEVIASLSEGGFDPRYGARPLKRTIDEYILKPIGQYLIEHPGLSGAIIEVRTLNKKDNQIDFYHKGQIGNQIKNDRSKFKVLNEEIQNLRRWYQILSNSHIISELNSSVRRQEKRARQKANPGEADHLANSQTLLTRLKKESEEIYYWEEKFLLAGFEGSSFSHLEGSIEKAPTWDTFCVLLKDIFQWTNKSSSKVTLILTGDSEKYLANFSKVYTQVARNYGCRVKCGYFRQQTKPHWDFDPKKEGFRKPMMIENEGEVEALFNGKIPSNFLGLALEFSQTQIGLRFTFESGLHQFMDIEGNKNHVKMRVIDDPEFSIEQGYVADCTLLDRDFRNSRFRRIWNEPEYFMKDEILGNSMDGNKMARRDLPFEFDEGSIVSLIEITLLEKAMEAIKS